MKIDFWGHASMRIEGTQGAVVFDPLLFGRHHHGLYDVYPHRQLKPRLMPSVDALVISHGHEDHFDFDSIDKFPRQMPILVPKRSPLAEWLAGMMFSEVTPLDFWDEASIGSMKIIATPPDEGAQEAGFLIIEGDQVIWNAVDTFPSLETLIQIHERFPKLDLAILPWQPLQDVQFASGAGVSFPFAMYARAFSNALQLHTRAVVAGSCGFRVMGSSSWLNHVNFPMTRARFVYDLEQAKPELAGNVLQVDPGDRVEVTAEGVLHQPQTLDYCERAEEYRWETFAFEPHLLGFPVTEEGGSDFALDECSDAVAALLTEELSTFVQTHPARFMWHFRWKLIAQLRVIFHDGQRDWVLDFSGPQLEVRAGADPRALMHTVVSASALIKLVAQQFNFEYLIMSGQYRHAAYVYLPEATGIRLAPAGYVADPLRLLLGDAESEQMPLVNRIVQNNVNKFTGAIHLGEPG